MVKIKFFNLDNGAVSEEATAFMESVNVLDSGILLTQGHVGILYKDFGDVGMSTQNMVIAASGELAKCQKNFVIQEGLVRAYSGMIEGCEAKLKVAQDNSEKERVALDAYAQTYDSSFEVDLANLKDELKAAEVAWQQAPKAKRPELLKPIHLIGEKIKVAQPKFDAYKAQFDSGSSEISARMGTFAVEAGNIMGDIKGHSASLAEAIDAREHARTFIVTTKKLIADLTAETVEGLQK